jgi:hypothetical protein
MVHVIIIADKINIHVIKVFPLKSDGKIGEIFLLARISVLTVLDMHSMDNSRLSIKYYCHLYRTDIT